MTTPSPSQNRVSTTNRIPTETFVTPIHRTESSAAMETTNDPAANVPNPLCGPLVWSGADFEDRDSYSCQMNQSDIEEIDMALQSFKALGLDGDMVTRQNFALPSLEPRLLECAKTIHTGRGFFILRGLNATRYSIEDSTIVFLGIASYIAHQRGLQDRKGNILSHITDSKLWKIPQAQRHGIHSRSALPYHNDMGCDVLALQVRQCATVGGHTYLSSAWTAYNQLLEEDPATVDELLTPEWPVQISGRNARYYLAPALAIHQGRLMASLDPGRLGPHPAIESKDIPNLTPAQITALEKMSEAAEKNELRLDLDAGDVLFLNNWSLLHRRDSYVDGERTSRHMVRLWLRNTELGWAVPQSLMPPWLRAFGDEAQNQQGIYSLVPMPEYKAPKYSAGSAAFMIEDSDMSDGR